MLLLSNEENLTALQLSHEENLATLLPLTTTLLPLAVRRSNRKHLIVNHNFKCNYNSKVSEECKFSGKSCRLDKKFEFLILRKNTQESLKKSSIKYVKIRESS